MIPAKNGMPYLEVAVSSVLSVGTKDLEILVSVERNETQTLAFLETIDDSRLTIIHPEKSLSMMEHWDWVQTHASLASRRVV